MYNSRQSFIPFIGRKDHNYYGGYIDVGTLSQDLVPASSDVAILTTAINTKDYILKMSISSNIDNGLALVFNSKTWVIRCRAFDTINLDFTPHGLKIVGSNTLYLRNLSPVNTPNLAVSFQYVHFVD